MYDAVGGATLESGSKAGIYEIPADMIKGLFIDIKFVFGLPFIIKFKICFVVCL